MSTKTLSPKEIADALMKLHQNSRCAKSPLVYLGEVACATKLPLTITMQVCVELMGPVPQALVHYVDQIEEGTWEEDRCFCILCAAVYGAVQVLHYKRTFPEALKLVEDYVERQRYRAGLEGHDMHTSHYPINTREAEAGGNDGVITLSD